MGILDPAYEFWGSGGPAFDRQWFIETFGDEHGYSIGVIGSLTPDDWFNFIDTVDRLFVDGSSGAVVLQSNVDSLWGIAINVTLQVEGYGTVILNWNSATAYVLTDPVFTAYVIANAGNTLGLKILPTNQVSSLSKRETTTLLEPIITTLGDNIIHTGS